MVALLSQISSAATNAASGTGSSRQGGSESLSKSRTSPRVTPGNSLPSLGGVLTRLLFTTKTLLAAPSVTNPPRLRMAS